MEDASDASVPLYKYGSILHTVPPYFPMYALCTGELAAALDDFDEQIIINPLAYEELKYRPSLEERLESIISGAALMADSSCTRDERRERYFLHVMSRWRRQKPMSKIP